MTSSIRGLIWCCAFVVLDATQAVFFGGMFQRMDSFLIGGLVFGFSSTACLLWTYLKRSDDLDGAFASTPNLIGLNVTAAGAWVAYLMAIQLVEPAVVFTIFSGVIPIAASLAGHFGFRDAPLLRNTVEAFGYVLLALGMVALTAFTLMGWSGFVRGGPSTAAGGLSLAALSGALIAGMLLYSRRLDRAGVGPVAQFGLRFPLYIILTTFGFLLGLDDKGPMTEMDLLLAFVAGLILLAFPIYAVQKAVSLTSTLTIGAFAAMGPLVVFALQVLEGRVGYSRATLLGLTIYFVGALIAVVGSTRATLTENLES